MNCCIFCKKRANSDEHVIAKCLIEEMDAKEELFTAGHQLGVEARTRGAHTLNSFTTNCVCRKCNSEWMGDLEVWFRANLGPLIRKDLPQGITTTISRALQENRIFARWALKSTITFDKTTMMDEIVKESVAVAAYTNNLPQELVVDIGLVRHSDIRIFLPKGFWAKTVTSSVEFYDHKDGIAFQALFQLRHLAIRVTVAPKARILYCRQGGAVPLQVFPEAGDPATSWYMFDTFQDFANSAVLDPTYIVFKGFDR